MLVRLVVSGAAACVLLVVAIGFGMRTLRGGPMPDEWGSPDRPPPVGIPLHRVELDAPRFTERDVAALRDFLSVGPGERLEDALAASDVRFLGVSGITLDVPSVDDPARAKREGRVLSIPGTTDTPISDEHGELVDRARRYAAAYNALLIRRGTGPE